MSSSPAPGTQHEDHEGKVLVARIQDLADQFPAPYPGAVEALHHGSLTAELWKAEGQPDMFWHHHPQDEIYVIVSGTATFVSERGVTPSCNVGDVVFCPAGLKHNFKDFSRDFTVWIFVYGPSGGESTQPH
jgi:mannose-6-phosphate isomerase-like protein (cupin superfamily)